jgi:hypothetical protein
MSALWQILLKKSFLADEQNFSGPLMRSAGGDVRDHIALHKNDQWVNGFIQLVKLSGPADNGIDYKVKSEPGDVPK